MNTTSHALRRGVAIGLAAMLGAAVLAPNAIAQPPRIYSIADLKALELAFVDLAEKVQPSVVSIRTYELIDIGQGRRNLIKSPLSKGSGFIVEPNGTIVTNYHVVEGAGAISVRLHNGLIFDAELVQSDQRSDIAVIKIDGERLLTVKYADLEKVRINQWAFACGNPFGLGSDDGRLSVTYGVVSALGRQLTQRLVRNPREAGMRYYGNLIETSAAINPGVSGGPLFNIDGEVIGIVTAIETSSGVNEGHGYAIPTDRHVRRVIETLAKGEPVRYGFLGVQVGDLDAGPVPRFVRGRVHHGAVIEQMMIMDGPAAKAGLKAKDVVIEFDGEAIENSDHLVRLVGFTPVGTEAEVVFLRNSVRQKTVVRIADREELLGVTMPRVEKPEPTEAAPDDTAPREATDPAEVPPAPEAKVD
jgi:serine protease Do